MVSEWLGDGDLVLVVVSFSLGNIARNFCILLTFNRIDTVLPLKFLKFAL